MKQRLMLTLAVLLTGWTSFATAQGARPSPGRSDLAGVYQAIPAASTLPGGLRNSGSPSDVALLPAALAQLTSVNLDEDPERMCQPIGPFRMMARERTKIELVPVLAKGLIVMLFEDISHGHVRTIHLSGDHPATPAPTWQGHSAGRWEGDTLVIDTVGFNDRTWLNAAGARHSDGLRLVERIRPVLGGQYLEYTVTADDPMVLAKPFTYTRYYEKLLTGIGENVCED